MTSFSGKQLKIKAKTWSRDSYGLYDYETSTVNVQNFLVNGPCDLFRVDNGIVSANPLSTLPTNDKNEGSNNQKENRTVLASVYENNHGIQIVPNRTSQDGVEDDFWRIVERKENSDGYMIKAGDVIRLGRIAFKVNQIKVVEENETNADPNQKLLMDSIKAHRKEETTPKAENQAERKMSSSATCKICLSDHDEPEDPLVSPCNCTGSMKYVHLQCLQNWVESKLNMQKNKKIVTIFWKSLYCEVCKQKFPLNIEHNGQELSLIPIKDKISGSYVVIESFSKEKDSTGIHLIDLSSNQDFKMGRGHDCDLKIPDISVSRVHAFLVVKKGNLYLKDNQSKFGTLVLFNGPILVNDDILKTPWLQNGRTIFKFAVKKSWTSFLPCVGTLLGLNKLPKIGKFFGDNKSTNDASESQLNTDKDDTKKHLATDM